MPVLKRMVGAGVGVHVWLWSYPVPCLLAASSKLEGLAVGEGKRQTRGMYIFPGEWGRGISSHIIISVTLQEARLSRRLKRRSLAVPEILYILHTCPKHVCCS